MRFYQRYYGWLTAWAALSPTFLAADVAESGFEHFITRAREGDHLVQGAEEFRFGGVNLPGMTVPYDYTLRLSERWVLPTAWEQEDGFKTMLQMGARVLRLWNLRDARTGRCMDELGLHPSSGHVQ